MPEPIAPNPYDCQNPVIDHRLFAGRDTELREVRYYLNQASVTRPTNLAFIGARGSGKTSLLHMTSHYAREAGLAVVEVRFDESHGHSQVSFFFHLFDSIVATVFRTARKGSQELCFGGMGGEAYAAYIDAAYGHERVDPEKLGFLFPFSYAAAMSRGRSDFVLPQSQISEDLRRISREVGRPIVLLLDECNVVASKREILQALRNIFQDQPGYMVVMAGTESLFPLIDEVFSPVGRGFKQISVGAYAAPEDTYDCMLAPLVASKLDQTPISAFKPTADVVDGQSTPHLTSKVLPPPLQDLHRFTSGSPLEIRRACHFMYRDMQMRGGSRMRMTSSVLESVLQDLASSSDRRDLLSRLKRLRPAELEVVSALSCFGRELTESAVQNLVALRCVLADDKVPSRDDLRESLRELERQELVVLDTESERARWIAGDLESILAKYVARAANLPAGNFPSREEQQAHFLGMLSGSKFLSILSQSDGRFRAGRWSPWFRLVDDRQHLDSDAFGYKLGDLGCFGRFMVLYLSIVDNQSRSRLTSGIRWAGKVPDAEQDSALAYADDLRREVSRVNELLSGVSDRFMIGLEVQWCCPTDPAFTSESRAREVCSQRENRQSAMWMTLAHNEICEMFIATGPSDAFAAGVDALISEPETGNRGVDLAINFPNIGFVALACGLPKTREFFRRVRDQRKRAGESEALELYNAALSHIICETPDLASAESELSALLERQESLNIADQGGYRALVGLQARGEGVLALTLWMETKEPMVPARLVDFVRGSLAAIRSARESSVAVRVLKIPYANPV